MKSEKAVPVIALAMMERLASSSYSERDETDAIAEVESEVTNDNKDSGGLL
jgi:hypothetical protein